MSTEQHIASRLPWVEIGSDANDESIELIETRASVFDEISRGLFGSAPAPLLVGHEGVGKTSLLCEFARRCSRGEHAHLVEARFVLVNCGEVPSRDGEQFFRGMYENCSQTSGVVWCLDGFGHLVNEQTATEIDDFLRVVESSRCRLVGALKPQDYIVLNALSAQLAARFRKIEVLPTSVDETRQIAAAYASELGRSIGIGVGQEAISSAVSLTSNLMLNQHQPAKSIRVLKQACEDLLFERVEHTRHVGELTIEDVERVVANETGISLSAISNSADIDDFTEPLQQAIVGQDEVLDEVNRELRLIRAGLNDAGRPASVMLFAGMTGVGKTELAKRIAEIYSSSQLHTYTMANFSEPHSVSGIIGVPPGYVGFDQGGRLVNELNANPYSVFLLDEAEKAHPDVWKPFLNLFDEGWVADQRGIKAYADRAIFILTTNAGERQIAKHAASDGGSADIHEVVKQALSRVKHERDRQPVFPAAFLARIGRIVAFRPLDESAYVGIAERACDHLAAIWRQKRRQELVMGDEVAFTIGQSAFRRNERSKGQDGGRVVRELTRRILEDYLSETTDVANDDALITANSLHISVRDGQHELRPSFSFTPC